MYRKEFVRVVFCEEGAKTAIGCVDMRGARSEDLLIEVETKVTTE